MITKPSKLFPCDCMGEGLTVSVEFDDIDGQIPEPMVNVAFWKCTLKYNDNDRLTWKDRCRIIWYAIRGLLPYTDMVGFNAKTARHFADHILYELDKSKKQKSEDTSKKIF